MRKVPGAIEIQTINTFTEKFIHCSQMWDSDPHWDPLMLPVGLRPATFTSHNRQGQKAVSQQVGWEKTATWMDIKDRKKSQAMGGRQPGSAARATWERFPTSAGSESGQRLHDAVTMGYPLEIFYAKSSNLN